jgi:hypothetical protein
VAKNIMLTRDEAELLVDLLMLTDNGHGHDLASEIREIFGMVSEDAELTARGMTLDDVRKQFALPPDAASVIRLEVEHSRMLVEEIERLRAVVDAARKIHHWHDSGADGMVVSAEHVRLLWAALAKESAP